VLCTGVPVHALAAGGERRYRVHAGSGVEVEVEQVVATLNAYAMQLVELPHELHAALTLALCTAPLDDAVLAAIGLDDRMPFYTLDLPYLWGRCVPDGRLIFGAGLIFPSDGDVRGVDLAQPNAAQSITHLEGRVRALHPALAAVPVTHRWGGPIAFRREGAPLLGRVPGAPGVILCARCAGHGVALSVRIGELIAAAVVDGAPLPGWGAVPPSCALRAP
jgi:glycine/D-amino acid oxidase-like deaminating enzyme